ncbi:MULTISPECIES: Sec-independent protein translocase subunit TatA/TatB [Spirosoma]|jgi:sec-independent protein translocase protein TatA|uniref:Sec-independent protein translocase protein TatA n=2 Tax=Spirosoma TaxID=107 RepID=A0A6G9AXL8_9BACT|nr:MULTISPECIES: twin-arginine translocase TatA/TatE family subunit [Spirosoma]QHV98844.1 twin-arginine translocase TatA/TatE family subunit [Spirosoma endbachense]QIP17160.1 twin-arginine translocase TatA/TatE family subunit [Spirosoma aureum]
MILASVLAFMGLGGQEMVFIFLALLLLFGAKKIPELARGLGKGIKEFKDATKDVRDNIEEGLKESEK